MGAVIVSPDRHDVFFGYNGFPSRLEDDPDRLNHRESKLEDTIHAEINAILNSKRSIDGFTIYTTFVPCKDCATLLIGAGISRVVTITAPEELAQRWRDNTRKSLDKLYRANIPVVFYNDEALNDSYSGFDSTGTN